MSRPSQLSERPPAPPLTASQREAWFTVVVSLGTAALMLVMYPFVHHAAFGASGLFGLLAFGQIYLRRSGRQAISDERDLHIRQRSLIGALGLSWLVVGLLCLAAVSIYGEHGSVPISTLFAAFVALYIFYNAVQGLIVLVLYARGS